MMGSPSRRQASAPKKDPDKGAKMTAQGRVSKIAPICGVRARMLERLTSISRAMTWCQCSIDEYKKIFIHEDFFT
jgi:hypothetical protein